MNLLKELGPKVANRIVSFMPKGAEILKVNKILLEKTGYPKNRFYTNLEVIYNFNNQRCRSILSGYAYRTLKWIKKLD